nr:MAG TPA: hypothetical protein [Caudoviricetes sp.]
MCRVRFSSIDYWAVCRYTHNYNVWCYNGRHH